MHSSRRSYTKSKSQFEKISIEYHPLAYEEVTEAANFYESRQKNLGVKFLNSVEEALKMLQSNPLMWKADSIGRRKYHIKRFPFQLIYKMKESNIFILAVAHTSRRPGYWKLRG